MTTAATRRRVLVGTSTLLVAGLAGCSDDEDDDNESDNGSTDVSY